jgi:hypothetical protein
LSQLGTLREKQNYVYALPPLENLYQESSILYLFSPSHLAWLRQCQPGSARVYFRMGEVSFAKFLFLPSWFVKLLEANFSYFAKIKWMTS